MRLLLSLAILVVGPLAPTAAEPVSFEAGFATVDVTPRQPLRLSGYANRNQPFSGAQSTLSTRAMALRAAGGETFVLVALDTIGVDETISGDIASRLQAEFGIARRRFALACSHSHTTPHLAGGITNLFQEPLSEAERTKMVAYTERLKEKVVEAVGRALDDLAPARLAVGRGKVGFAVNRRVVDGGVYQGFGVTPGGAVDHHVDVLRISDQDGKPRGVVFNYACHATTLTGQQNAINGDWPGHAARDIEEAYPGITALCTIGCGADANPEPRGGPQPDEHARAHGRAMALEVGSLLDQELTPLTEAPRAAFGHAELPIDLPSEEQLKATLENPVVQEARRAEHMLNVIEEKGRLPASYPMPIQAWRFGDQLTMVYLGGEVVVDYAKRLKEELPGEMVWVTAYANDVFGYVASERVRSEGGYEVDFSAVFYNLPGRWSSGTEDVIVGRVKEILGEARE